MSCTLNHYNNSMLVSKSWIWSWRQTLNQTLQFQQWCKNTNCVPIYQYCKLLRQISNHIWKTEVTQRDQDMIWIYLRSLFPILYACWLSPWDIAACLHFLLVGWWHFKNSAFPFHKLETNTRTSMHLHTHSSRSPRCICSCTHTHKHTQWKRGPDVKLLPLRDGGDLMKQTTLTTWFQHLGWNK